jgi:hypothetical protein
MNFFDIICTPDNPILDIIFSYHRINLIVEYQSQLLLVNKKLRKIYIDHIENSIKMPIDLSKYSLNGIGNFSERLEYLKLQYPNSFRDSIIQHMDIKEIKKLTNLSRLYLDNIDNCDQIITKLNCKNIEHLSIISCFDLSNKSLSYIFDNFLNIKILEIDLCEDCSLKKIKNLKMLENLKITISEYEDMNIKYLYKIKSLKILHLEINSPVCCINYLGKFDNLTSITIVDQYGNEDSFVSYIVKNPLLEYITLEGLSLISSDIELLANKKIKKMVLNDVLMIGNDRCFVSLKNNIEKFKDVEIKCFACFLSQSDKNIVEFVKKNIKNFEIRLLP